ncbi:MAG TPA: ATP-binding protein [Planctomycetota bacterium]|nr:ATP-binding protein [Planctomycetota bacterium]
MDRETNERDKRTVERVKGLLYLRQAAVLVSLGVILVSQAEQGVFQTELLPTYLSLVFVCLVNLMYLVLLKRVRRIRRFAAVQICLDVVFATVLIYLNGAGESNITFLYFACILAASSILGSRPGMMVASMATVMLGLARLVSFLAMHYDWELPWVALTAPGTRVIGVSSSVAYLMAQAIAYYLVAALAGRLSHGLTGIRLLNEKILENVTDAVLVVDNRRRVRSINREATRLLGLPTGAKVVGEALDDVAACSNNARVLRELFGKRQHYVSQLTLVTTDGQTAPVAITLSPLRDERGERLGMVVMFVDLTERRRLEEALARAETMEMVGQLAASIAHEIRNPLACIRGSAQEIRSTLGARPTEDTSGTDGSREIAQLLDLMVKESDRINAIVTDFLHFSKMRPAALSRCNLTDVLTEVVTMLDNRSHVDGGRAGTARHHGNGRVSIVFDGDGPVFCLGDVEQLRQVFLNLGLNALDAMPTGGTLEIRIRRESAGRLPDGTSWDCPRVAVEFIDDGEGITNEVKAQLFDPFFTTRARGTGLGLSIVRRIVEAHKGHVEVETVPGQGSTFRVVLQRCPQTETTDDQGETAGRTCPPQSDEQALSSVGVSGFQLPG